MRKGVFILVTCLLCVPGYLPAQKSGDPFVPDSAWFADYFSGFRSPDAQRKKNALDSLEIVRSVAERFHYSPAVCSYYIEKAAHHLSSGRNDSAINCLETAIRLAKKENLQREGGDACLGLANLYQFNGNTLESAKYYLQAASLLKGLGRKRLLISLYRNFHNTLNRLNQKNNALVNMLSAIEADRSREADLVRIINTRGSEEGGLNFPDQTLVREGGRGGIYVIFGNAKFAVLDGITLGSYGANRDVQRIPAGTISLIPDFPRNGSILRELSGDYKVYIVKDSLLHLISTPDVLEIYGGWDAVYFTPPGSLQHFPKASQPVTPENVNTVFNLKQAFDNLTDSIQLALRTNTFLSNELSQQVAGRNKTLQQRNTLLWVSATGVIALLVIVVLLIRNFRQKRKEEELKRKTAIEKERTRIATDMHDDLGAGLSRIKFLSETIGIKKQQQVPVEDDISKIREYSHEMIDKMGEIVWALNEKNDSLNDLLSYTRSYAVEYLPQNGISCIVNLPGNIPEYSLGGELRRNIYLSVKEALHNVVKHSRASQVIMDIEAGKELQITIRDNGIGFNNETKPFRNGLSNMQARMQSIGGSFTIENDRGTRIKLVAPLAA